MSPELIVAAAIVVSLIAYFLLGGADFGGGVWDLLASGPRREEQRALIDQAIGPIWEANHVWLILATVLLFGAFPAAFALVATALHVPFTLFLLAIVFRGSSFVFRAYDESTSRRRRWGGLFSIASVAGPLLLGAAVGTIASGGIEAQGLVVTGGFFAPWLRPFPLAVGVLALLLASFLAATYLAYEAPGRALAEDFRRRALVTGALVLVGAAVCLLLAKRSAPLIYEGLTQRAWSLSVLGAGASAAALAIVALGRGRFGVARLAAGATVTAMLVGWALSQYPYLVPPALTLSGAAANPATLRVLLVTLCVGAPILGPSLYMLFRVFKSPANSGA